MSKESCSDCFNRDNEYTEAQFLVLNPPTYPRDVHLCRHHLVVMLDAFIHYSTVTKEITIIKLDTICPPKPLEGKKMITREEHNNGIRGRI